MRDGTRTVQLSHVPKFLMSGVLQYYHRWPCSLRLSQYYCYSLLNPKSAYILLVFNVKVPQWNLSYPDLIFFGTSIDYPDTLKLKQYTSMHVQRVGSVGIFGVWR